MHELIWMDEIRKSRPAVLISMQLRQMIRRRLIENTCTVTVEASSGCCEIGRLCIVCVYVLMHTMTIVLIQTQLVFVMIDLTALEPQ